MIHAFIFILTFALPTFGFPDCRHALWGFSPAPDVPEDQVAAAVSALATNWENAFDVAIPGSATADGAFALLFDHLPGGPTRLKSQADPRSQLKFTVAVIRSDFEGEELPPSVAHEFQMRSGAGHVRAGSAAVRKVHLAYRYLYDRYARQAPQRRNVVGKYGELDIAHARRTTHFIALYGDEVVGHAQTQFSRGIAEPLNLEIYRAVDRRPGELDAEVGRVFVKNPAEISPADQGELGDLEIKDYVQRYLYRLAFGHALSDRGAHRVHFEVTRAGLKVFQELSPFPLPARTIETAQGPLRYVNLSRPLAEEIEHSLYREMMAWRFRRVFQPGTAAARRKLVARLGEGADERVLWGGADQRAVAWPFVLGRGEVGHWRKLGWSEQSVEIPSAPGSGAGLVTRVVPLARVESWLAELEVRATKGDERFD